MLEDVEEAIREYEKQSTAAQCEAVIHYLDNAVRYARELMGRAHAILERRIAEERAAQLRQRPADFPASQSIGGK